MRLRWLGGGVMSIYMAYTWCVSVCEEEDRVRVRSGRSNARRVQYMYSSTLWCVRAFHPHRKQRPHSVGTKAYTQCSCMLNTYMLQIETMERQCTYVEH